MKKLLLTLVIVLCCTSAFAQKWETTHHDADELKEMEAYDSNAYSDKNGNMFVMWSNNEWNFKIITGSGIFNYYGESNMVSYVIGFYDKEEKLVEKTSTTGPVNPEIPSVMSEERGRYKLNKKIINYLRTSSGYVRFLIPLYGSNTGLDFKVPCINK